jgi:asparagine synthase (glutamine-hydrolysing)
LLIQHRKQLHLAKTKQLILAANVRIYNHRALRKQFEGNTTVQVIAKLFWHFTKKRTSFYWWNEWNFGFAIYDVEKDEYFIARDHMGIIPLYIGGMSTVRFMLLWIESFRRILYKNTIVSWTPIWRVKMANLYNGIKRDWTDYDVKDNETNIQDIKVALKQPFTDN